jgi:cytochrome P450
VKANHDARNSGISSCGHNLIVQDVVNRFTVDVIGATAFGMDTKALKESNSLFYQMARRSSDMSFLRAVKIFILMFAPKVASLLNLSMMDHVSLDFFASILTKALKDRENSNEKWDDFLQLMIEAKKGELKVDESELDAFEKEAQIQSQSKTKTQLTDELAIAQSVLFFIAGFDTVGAFVSFAVYIMAIHQDIQQKLYDEVQTHINKETGEMEYDSVGKLEYMDMVLSGWLTLTSFSK